MLPLSAFTLFQSGLALHTIIGDSLAASAIAVDDWAGFDPGRQLDDEARNKALKLLKAIHGTFTRFPTPITAETIAELVADLESNHRHSFDWLMTRVRAIERLGEKELKGKAFFYVSQERLRFWPKQGEPALFGEQVATNFYSANYDIQCAGVCLATSQSTAAVFHLMRVLEIGLGAFGQKFGVSLAHTNWGPAISEIEKKVREMHVDPAWKGIPDHKEQQVFFSQAAVHFGIIKDAWRNHTMHVRAKYTEPEAEQIFESVRALMQKLAERLSE